MGGRRHGRVFELRQAVPGSRDGGTAEAASGREAQEADARGDGQPVFGTSMAENGAVTPPPYETSDARISILARVRVPLGRIR